MIVVATFGLYGWIVVYPGLRVPAPRIIDVNVRVTGTDDAQPIADAEIILFDHPISGASAHDAKFDARAYNVETFAADANGWCRFIRAFPFYNRGLRQSRANVHLPGTWIKVSSRGRRSEIIQLDHRLPIDRPKNPNDEKPLVLTVALAKGAD